MHILVVGGCGYVGAVLVPALLERGHDVSVFDIMWFGDRLPPHPRLRVQAGDIRATDSVPMAGVDAVVHLANIANDPCSDLDPRLSWEVNVLATMGLAEAAIRHGVKQFIYASSGSVYGVKEELDVTEDLPLVPITDYNKTKMISERVLLSYQEGLALQIVRPATICGYSPRMRLDLSVNMLTMQALTKKRITVHGGGQIRPNIHIKDMVGVYLFFLEQGRRLRGIYNAGFENLSIMEIARRVARHVPAEIAVSEGNDPRSYRQNSDKLIGAGFAPRYDVEAGIRDVVAAYEAGLITDTDDCYNLRVMRKLG
ncbi:MAG: oxidoreductase [Elusimicrobia bacterium RBG_16_66_12]|nr:MAG: oxidoreductase [Elusimicrobia bacterium RBG_16_66_12]